MSTFQYPTILVCKHLPSVVVQTSTMTRTFTGPPSTCPPAQRYTYRTHFFFILSSWIVSGTPYTLHRQSLPRGVQSNSDNPFRQKGLSRNQSGCPAFKSNSDVNQLSSYTHSLQYRTFNGIYTVGGGAFPSPEKAKCVLR